VSQSFNFAEEGERKMPGVIVKLDPLTGRYNKLKLKHLTQDEVDKRMFAIEQGKILAEDAFPDCSRAAILFINTGECPEYEYINPSNRLQYE